MCRLFILQNCHCVCGCKRKFSKNINYNFTEEHHQTVNTQYNLTMEAMEISVDGALKRADFNVDGFISWDEYMHSLKLDMLHADEHREDAHTQGDVNANVVKK